MPEKKTFFEKIHYTTVSKVDRLFFVQNLQVMIRSGFPMAEALRTLSEQTKKKEFKKIILDLKTQVESGMQFNQALRKYEYIFSELFINLIQAGEISGNLEVTLSNLLLQLKKSYALSKKIKNALMYPCVIIVAMLGIGTGMIVFVLPNMVKMYAESNFILPWPTRVTIAVSNFLIANILVIGIIFVALIGVFFFILSREKGKYLWHTILLKAPIISTIMIKINLAKINRVLNSLIATDIPITDDFNIIARTVGNRVYRKYLSSVAEKIGKGESIYSVLKVRDDLFPAVVSQMINVGEQSGTLDNITKELADFYEEEVSDTMANLTVIIEPIIMLVIGAAVAFLAVSIIYPIYAVVNQIQ